MKLIKAIAINRFFYLVDGIEYMANSPYCLDKYAVVGMYRYYKNKKRWLKTYKRWTYKKKS